MNLRSWWESKCWWSGRADGGRVLERWRMVVRVKELKLDDGNNFCSQRRTRACCKSGIQTKSLFPLEPTQHLALPWGWIKSCICSENHVGLPGILHANENPELSIATIYSTSQACRATLFSLSSPLPLLTEIATDSDGLWAASMVNICLLMTWNRQGQLVKTWGPLWIWGLNTSFWCLCLRGFSPWNWSLPLQLHLAPGGGW